MGKLPDRERGKSERAGERASAEKRRRHTMAAGRPPRERFLRRPVNLRGRQTRPQRAAAWRRQTRRATTRGAVDHSLAAFRGELV